MRVLGILVYNTSSMTVEIAPDIAKPTVATVLCLARSASVFFATGG